MKKPLSENRMFADEDNRPHISALFKLLYKLGIYTPLNPLYEYLKVNTYSVSAVQWHTNRDLIE